MEKGILKITPKSGYIKIKGGRVALKKEMPHIGKGKEFHNEECEYEGDPATKVVILRTGDVFTIDQVAIERKEKEKEAKEKGLELEKEMQKLFNRQFNGSDSFVLDRARVPSDTRESLIDDPDNFILKLNRFAMFDFKDNKEKEKQFSFYNSRAIQTQDKRMILPKFQIKSEFGTLFQKETQLAEKLFLSIKERYGDNKVFRATFKPEWRLVSGLGGDSVYEVGMTLHHIYGVPYIPASSIKGVLRSWVIQSRFNNNEGEAIRDEDFCTVFGCPANIKIKKQTYQSCFGEARKGKVDFFDAFPIMTPKIEPDVMNPHYADWYSEKSAPVDTGNPVPIFFLTVKDTAFQFVMASNELDINNRTFWNNQNLNWWLENALSEHGIGAKTAVGYGRMGIIIKQN